MSEHIQTHMVDPQEQALYEIADRRFTRDDVAITYAFMLRQQETDRVAQINQAILDRWSMAALKYIKTKAWRLVSQGERAGPSDFVCTDVRLDFISLECHPVADRDAVLSIAVRDNEDGFAVAAGLGREDARALAAHIIEVLSGKERA